MPLESCVGRQPKLTAHAEDKTIKHTVYFKKNQYMISWEWAV